jgi:hypothetical protein
MDKLNSPKEDEEESSALALGSLIHLYLLEPHKFIVSEIDKPTGKLGDFCDAKLEGLTDEEALIKAGYKQSLETVLKGYEKTGKSYVEEKINNPDAIFINKKTKYLIEKSVDGIYRNKVAYKLLHDDNSLNELELFWESEGVKKKGKVDKLILSEFDTNNTLYNIDVKTTSSDIYKIPINIGDSGELEKDYIIDKSSYMYSFLKYGYHRQIAMYDEGIKDYALNKENRKNANVIHLQLVINTTTFECLVYKISDYWINLGYKELKTLIENYKWHKETNYWETPKDFIEGIIKV